MIITSRCFSGHHKSPEASWYHGKPSSLGIVSGAIAGMVAITPAAGFVTPMVSILIGAVARPNLLW